MEKFPQYLHRPYQVLWFEPDDMGLVSILFMLCILFGGWPFWVALFVVPYVYMKFKSNAPRGFFKHLLYHLGVYGIKIFPHSMIDEFYVY